MTAGTDKLDSAQLALPVRLVKGSGRRRKGAADPRQLRVAGLFAGVGGIELGLARSGHEALLLCENDPAARAVLDEHFPRVEKHADIRTLKKLPSGTDLLAAGFPCQDLSQAGKTEGISGSRSGLVGEVFRLLDEERTPLVLLENVPFMLQLAGGKALEVIVEAVEQLGYKWAYRIIDTRAFGLPQRRERVFFLAALNEDPRDVLLTLDAGEPEPLDPAGLACGFYWTEGIRGLGWAVNAVPTLKGGSTIGIPSPPAVLMPGGDIVKPDIRDLERMQGFAVDWTKPAERVVKRGHRWKLVGNAVTVDVAAWVGRQLASPGRYRPKSDRPLRPGDPWPRAAWNVGRGRFASPVSAWPSRRRGVALHRFLKFKPEPLSAKGAAGFLGRARTGNLRFPPGFLEAVEAHLRRMEAAVAA